MGKYKLVDFDRTLATYSTHEKQKDALGEPIPAMVERVVRWLHMGHEVRLFTARASRPGFYGSLEEETLKVWCKMNLGQEIKIQNWKDFDCDEIWDDIAVTIEPNSGFLWTTTELTDDPLEPEEEMELVEPMYERR